jgi:hypothetical protein
MFLPYREAFGLAWLKKLSVTNTLACSALQASIFSQVQCLWLRLECMFQPDPQILDVA